jgi:hypothetical protein
MFLCWSLSVQLQGLVLIKQLFKLIKKPQQREWVLKGVPLGLSNSWLDDGKTV